MYYSNKMPFVNNYIHPFWSLGTFGDIDYSVHRLHVRVLFSFQNKIFGAKFHCYFTVTINWLCSVPVDDHVLAHLSQSDNVSFCDTVKQYV